MCVVYECAFHAIDYYSQNEAYAACILDQSVCELYRTTDKQCLLDRYISEVFIHRLSSVHVVKLGLFAVVLGVSKGTHRTHK